MEDGATRYGLCDDDAKDVELSKLYEQQATIALASSKAKLDEEIKEVVVSKTEPQRSTRDFEAYGRLINRPGLIQAHGCTILLQKKTLKILASSMNSLDHLGVSANVIINATLGEVGFLDADSLQDIQVCMQAADPTLTNPRHVKTVSGKTLHAILHHVKDGTIVDFEPLASESTNTATGVTACFRMIHEAMERIGVIKDLSTLYDGIVKEIQNLSGYDRVMLYQFHEDNHGEVVAECRKDVNIPSYLNLHFPATDIPQVSRRLFMTMKQRMVGDIKASQVGFVQAPELAEENLLLSQSQLRGVTGCHAQYLENIGVRATLVNAVVVGPTHSSAASAFGTKDNSRKLWGLIVCHNLHDKRIVEFHVRSALLFLVDVFALQLQRLMDIMETAQNELMWSAQNELYNNVVTTDDFNIGAVADNPECLMKFVGASGAAVLSGGSLHLIGRTPRAVQLNELADWIRAQPSYDDQRVVCTRSLVADGAPGAASYVQDAAGLLAVGVPQKATSSVPDSMIIWFRSEVVESVTWAGTNEQHVPKRESDYLQPRESFKAYLKTMANTSARWEPRILVSVRSFQEVLSLTQTCDNKMKTLAHMTSRVSVQRSITVSQLTAVSRELNNVIESAPMAVIFVNSSLEITEINEFFKNIIGSAADDCLGRPINRHLTSASYARLTQLIVEVLGCGKHSHAVLEVTGAKHTVSLQFVVSPRRDQQGGVTGAVLVGQLSDVQPDVLASLTEPLAAAEDEFFLSKMATPVFSIGQCGNVCQWNQAMENVTGLPNSSARGRLLVGDIFGCKDRNSLRLEDERSFTAFAAAIMSALEGNRVDGHMLTFSSVSGRIIELLCTASTRKHGTESNVYLFCQDLSLLRSLENATIVRTAAEAVASSNSRTLAFLCHEIRNPLNGIMAVVSFMEHEQHLLHDEHRDLVKSAASSCLQVRRIVDDVLDISKIEEGKLVLDNTAFNVRATAAACVDQVGYAGQEKGLDVIMDVTGMEVSVLLGDSCRIQQVVSNFLWNAVKFTEKGKVELQVQSWVTDAGNARVKFSIVDTGPGMTESMQSKIFKAFEMGAGKMTRWGGTGLGLNISSVLAEMMGGSISCQSAPGEGTTMSFEVPLRVPSVHEIKVLDSKTPLKASTEKGGRTKLVRGRMKAIGQDDQLIDQSHAGNEGGGGGRRVTRDCTSIPEGGVSGQGLLDAPRVREKDHINRAHIGLGLATRALDALYGQAGHSYNVVTHTVDASDVAVCVDLIMRPGGDGNVITRQAWGSCRRAPNTPLQDALEEATASALHSASILIKGPGGGLLPAAISRRISSDGSPRPGGDAPWGEPQPPSRKRKISNGAQAGGGAGAAARAIEKRRRQSGEIDVAPSGGGGRQYKVLLVDDEGINRMVLKKGMSRMGATFQCEMGEDGKDIVRYVIELGKRYDLILADECMEALNGSDAIAKVRDFELANGLPPTPAVIVSANFSKEHIQSYAVKGANGVLPKPVNVVNVCSSVLEYIEFLAAKHPPGVVKGKKKIGEIQLLPPSARD